MPPARSMWWILRVRLGQVSGVGLYAFVGLVIVIIVWIVVLYVPRYIQYGAINASDKATAEASFRGSLVQAIVGLTVLGGLYYTARNLRLSRAGQLTDRFSKAIEQIGNSDINVRIGGLYALEQVARDSRNNAMIVTEILLRFVRNQVDTIHSHDNPAKVTQDIDVALQILGRRPSADREPDRLDLSDLKIDGANLEYANLTDANLCYVKATRLRVAGAKLRRTLFYYANVQRSMFSGSDARQCGFSLADLRYSFFVDVNLEGADFGETDLRYAIFKNSKRSGLSLRGADMTGARLDGADLRGIDLRSVIGLTQDQIDLVILDANTKLPAGLSNHSQPQ
jgi:uncharacterized protein YjbI with pentapeptide repeats